MTESTSSQSTSTTHERRVLLTVVGFIAGHVMLPNVWFHAGWLVIGGLLCLRGLQMPPKGVFAPVWLFLGWMALRSFFNSGAETAFGVLSAALLVLAVVLFFNGRVTLGRCGRWNARLATIAALVSIIWHVWRWGWNFTDYRLENLLVHGGLNAVCTGLTFGFAAVWICASPFTRGTAASALLLTTATFCTSSRAAMLALLAGHAVLLIVNGWRQGWKPLAVLVTSFTLYLMSSLLVPANPERQTSPRVSPSAVAAPLQKTLTRSNEGRLSIYRAGWSCLDTPQRHLIGIGQWGTRQEWQCGMDGTFLDLKSHLHSAYFATYVHGGLIGAGLLLLLMTRVACAAYTEARKGHAAWPALFSYGFMALVFDGESLAHLLTLPRFETLLFWLPAVMLLAQASESSQAASCSSPA